MPLVFHDTRSTSIPDISVSEFLSNCLLEAKGYEYRGQGDKNWNLVPSLFRDSAGKMLNVIDRTRRLKYFSDEKSNFYMDFQKIQSLAGPNEELIADDGQGYKRLTMMAFFQHFGLPTPLLDWTSSPLVALFMSLYERPAAAKDIALFRLDPAVTPPEIVFVPYNKIRFRRISTQLGGVMFFGEVLKDKIDIHTHLYDEYIAHSPITPFIQKLNIKINAGDVEKILNALHANGFREEMIFPNSMQWTVKRIRDTMF